MLNPDAEGSGRATNTDVLRVEQLRVGFTLHGQLQEVVRGVSFRVPAGKTVALVGESGSGKSVNAQAIMGLLPRNATIIGGRILFQDAACGEHPINIAGLERDGRKMRSLRGGRIAMIFQEPMSSLSPVHTIGNQIEEALQLHHPLPATKARAEVEDMLALVGFRDPHRAFDMYAFELSGGLRQRAMLAMALICRPELLIADEPTTALDVTIQAQVLSVMKDLQREFGMAILLITHDLGVVANMADEVVVIYHGEIMEAGSIDDAFRRPGHPYLRALIKALPHFDMGENERLVALREVKQELGALLGKGLRKADVAQNSPLLSVRDLCKSYSIHKTTGFFGRGHNRVVPAADHISFDIKRGECLGLVGESGSGKTTVSKLIMRAVSADSGSIIFNDGEKETDVLKLNKQELRRFRPNIQMIFQDPVSSLSPRMTVLNVLQEPMEIHALGDSAQQRARVKELMRAVGLDPRFLNRYPHSFSGGQRQRIGIARALALDPSLIICDEPVSALDVSVQAQVLNLLKDLQRELGLTYLFISHNLAVVDYVANRIAVMARGRIVEIAPRERLFREPAHPYTKALLKSVPFPDLDRPLDLGTIARTNPTDVSSWPAAFRGDGDAAVLSSINLGEGHYVLARENANRRELVS
jgi:peptide/nickel transport system ATP-binding protein